ncbi:DUF418 domain-containing protein [Aquipuribacter hungaricus]|uniref:DUF418 domain-containing protein n=1 Tax=Aquipuribacter hungaricus TaxID=545624 RepID=A0ABV7WJ26_9MICO
MDTRTVPAATTVAVGPTPRAERAWAPDLARGAVLLGIALANVSIYLHGADIGAGGRPVGGSVLDRTLDVVVTTFVNDRSRPMFALLFGFGLVTMVGRLTARGLAPRERRRVLLRRQLWLVAFGAVHAALLFEGDILGMYGVTGLVVLLLLHRRPRVLVAWGTASLVVLALLFGAFDALTEVPRPPTDYLVSVVERVAVWVVGVLGGTLLMLVLAPMLAGVAMARAGLLDRPWEHLPLLRRLAVGGVVLGVVGGLPYGLVVGEAWEPGIVTSAVLAGVHAVTGTAMGVAYVSLFALWAAHLHRTGAPRRGAPAVLAAVGERSLTCYLLQSVVLAPLLAPWGLALGDGLGTAAAYGTALTVWLVTVGVAWALATAGRRGPAEVLLRRLTYGPRSARSGGGRTAAPLAA